MNWCEACFSEHAQPLVAITVDRRRIGECSFCGSTQTPVWKTDELTEVFFRLLERYEERSVERGGVALVSALQRDWELFARPPQAKREQLVREVFKSSKPPIGLDASVGLRRGGFAEDVVSHADTWERLTEELRNQNRFFPTLTPNFLPALGDSIHSCATTFDSGQTWFRARVSESPDGLTADEMSMPPPRKARAGRANPLGIPHLYLGRELETCIRECRAVQHSFVTVATFTLTAPARLVDLERVERPNPFQMDEHDATEALAASRMLRRLGEELRRPVRPTDNEVEYVPTQYLSAFVKSLRSPHDPDEPMFDGILYSSSLFAGGANAVLFSDAKVTLGDELITYEITEMQLEHRVVA